MRLAAKLILLFLVGVLLIVGLFSYLTIDANRRLAIDEHQRYAEDLAATIQSSLTERGVPPQELPQYVTQSAGVVRHVRVRWVELNSAGGLRPSVPTELIFSQQDVITVSRPTPSGENFLYTYVPVRGSDAGETPAGRIEVAAPDTSSAELWRQSMFSSLIALLGVAALSGIVIWIGGVSMVGRPLNQLIDKVHRVGRGDFEGPVDVRSGDELGKLATAINEMCAQLAAQRQQLQTESASRLETLQQLRHAERLNSVGRMAAGIAHEIGTPLNVVIGRAQLIERGRSTPEQAQQNAEIIISEAQRIAGIVSELLDFTRARKPNRSIQSINELVTATVELMQPMARKHDVELSVQLPKQPVMVNLDSAQMQQVLTNLVLNAIQSTTGDGRVDVSVEAVADRVQMSVRDNGSGISADDAEHLFEPFFTTKDVGEGTGLGLSISHGIVREHDGEIEVDSTPGQGSCFTVWLPVGLPEASRRAQSPSHEESS